MVVYFLLLYFGVNPLSFYEELRKKEFKPEFRPESGFGFSREVYHWLFNDYADEESVRRQAKLLKEAGVASVQIYFMRWPEVVLDSSGRAAPTAEHIKINDMLMRVLSEEEVEIHSEFFTHFSGYFESQEINPESPFSINVPASQVPPISQVVKSGLTNQFRSYVSQIVSRYPQVKFWGFMNEADTQDLQDLITLQNAFYEEVKKANPNTLVGAAGPTFPEIIAPYEKLNPAVRKAFDDGNAGFIQDWRPYPEIYEFWKEFYSRTNYDVVQLHQLGVSAWMSWRDDSFDEKGNFNPGQSLRWQLLKAGIENIRKLVGNKLITSQVHIDTDAPYGTPEYWQKVQLYFGEAASGKYEYDFLDIYQLRENFVKLPDGSLYKTANNYVFNETVGPSPLYDTVQEEYTGYQQNLLKEFYDFLFRSWKPRWRN